MSEEAKKFELLKVDPNNIIELDPWEEKLNKLVEENPFIAITDPETYKTAKKRRTNLKSGRTEVQKQDGLLATFLRKFRSTLKDKNESLVSIVQPGEEKQQTEIDRWEKIIQDKKDEEQRVEEARVKKITDKIEEISVKIKTWVQELTFPTIESTEKNIFEYTENESSIMQFEEYQPLFDEVVDREMESFNTKKATLIDQEETRVNGLKNERIQQIQKMEIEQSRFIERATIERKDLAKEVKNFFDAVEIDFGDQKELFQEMVVRVKKKASDHIEKLISDQKKEDELAEMKALNEKNQRIAEQTKRIATIQEGYLDRIDQMTASEHVEEVNKIKGQLNEKGGIEPQLESLFDGMVGVVNRALKSKLESIAEELKGIEAKKDEKLKSRIKKLKTIGLKKDKDFDQLVGYGLMLDFQKIRNEENFPQYFTEVQRTVNDMKSDEERSKLIGPEKEKLSNYLDEVFRFEIDAYSDVEEMEPLCEELQSDFEKFVKDLKEKIQKF